jgi:hypothetical protein
MKNSETNQPILVSLSDDGSEIDPVQYCEHCRLPINRDGTVPDCPYSCDRNIVDASSEDDYKELDFNNEVVTQYDLDEQLNEALLNSFDEEGC